MRTKIYLISVLCALFAFAPQAGLAWTMSPGLVFQNGDAVGFVTGVSPASESVDIHTMFSSATIEEAGNFVDQDSATCTLRLPTDGSLVCGAVASDTTLTNTCLYHASGGIIADDGDPPDKTFALSKVYRTF